MASKVTDNSIESLGDYLTHLLKTEEDFGIAGSEGLYLLSKKRNPKDPFYAAYVMHDLRYYIVPETGNKPEPRDIRIADQLFLEQMLKIARHNKTLANRIYLTSRARLFYGIVVAYRIFTFGE